MTVENYFEDVDSKPNFIDNVASLRFNQGITVPSPPPRNRLTHSTPHSRSMRDSRNQTCSSICRQKYQSTSFVQLANVVNSPACEVTSCQSAHLCYSNYSAMGSSLSLFIRRRLSSPFIPSRKSLSPLSSIRWSSFLLIIATFFLTFTSHMATAISASVAKSPLTRTDVSNTFDLKTFSGMGPTKSNHKRGSSYKDSHISSRVATHSLDKGDFRLDFQTLKVIKKWGNNTRDVLLVAGRDYIYMINATVASNNPQIQYIERLKWASPPGTKSACQLMGKHKHECNNFLRIVELQDDGRLYVCGTDSYEPKCRYYSRDQFSSSSSDPAALHEEACHGQCECPYNPSKSSVHLYTSTSTGDRLFSAVINDFMGNNPVLMRKDTPIVYSVEKWFKDPTFIKMVESDDGKVYLFFRETATSLETGSSTPATYARVAQICKNDTGGTTVLTYQWTTFVKARMKCSIPDSASGMGFNFDNLTSVSEITRIVGQDGRPMDVVFATFTTPWDWDAVAMSAVCVYSMDTIKNLFEFGGFAGEEELRSGLENTDSVDPTEDFETLVKVVRVPHYEVPNPRPGKCPRPGFPVSDKTLYFAKEHFLMYDPVTSLHQQPMYISESDVRATQVSVDNNAGDGQSLIVYFGTEDGRIFRLRPRLQASSGPQSLLLEEKRIVDKQECSSGSSPCGVLALHVSRPAQANSESFNQEANLKPTIFVAFTNRMTQLPLAVCKQYGNEKCCNIDPDCGWYDGICVQRTWHNQDQLPPVSNMTEIPSDCQAISSTGCSEDFDEICSLCPKLPQPTRGCPVTKQPPKLGKDSLVNPRSVIPPGTINDQPETVNRRGSESVRSTKKKLLPRSTDTPMREIFTERVLPSISQDFHDTYSALESEQRLALIQQLQNALETTASLVFQNHKKEYCLSASVNSLTHTYPLLLGEVEAWHEVAMKKMTAKGLQHRCWGENLSPPCIPRVSFSLPFAPTLWEPLTHLLREFSAECDTAPSPPPAETPPSGCNSPPGVVTCKNGMSSRSPPCRIQHCHFKYAVDVLAFFRHVNDSRNFLTAEKVLEPLWKPVNVTITPLEAIKGHLELFLNHSDSNKHQSQHFEIHFSPVTEKVKMIFYYVPKRDCSLNNADCAGIANGCNPMLEKSVSSLFDTVMNGLKKNDRPCESQISRFSRGRRSSSIGGRPARSRRSSSRSEDNEIHRDTPRRCRFVDKPVTLPSGLRTELFARAEERGGDYSGIQNRITFYSREDVKNFFENQCSIEKKEKKLENLGVFLRKKNRKSSVKVEIFVSRRMPFVIEKQKKPRRIKVKYFTHAPKTSH